MAELLLSAFLQVLFERLASRDLFNFVRQLQGGVHSELQKWGDTLRMIRAVLKDAEEKELMDNAVKIWLDELRDLAYDAEDILDEFATEALKHKLNSDTDQPSTSKIRRFLPAACFCCFNPSTVKFNMDTKSKIERVTNRFREHSERRTILGLQVTSGGTSTAVATAQYRPPSSSVATERAVYGRNEDKAKILEMVLSHEPSDAIFRVIPIVGMPGLGKTTLAREVYNDKAVEDFKFDVKAWVCVSDVFDVMSISKTLLTKITSKPCGEKDFDEVQIQLKKAMEGKKFLLVLDDVWNEDYNLWQKLRAPFMAGAPTSRIIVTTRHGNVASTMGSVEQPTLKLLSDEACWSVFMMHATEGRDFNAQLFREKVVTKCGGLPLAAEILGGLLRFKSDDTWDEILNSNLWDFSQQSGVLSILRLSYHYLPSHLKRCFAYSAIFPKDYEIDKQELVLLWRAEGIIRQPSNEKQVEDWGSKCFDDLVSRSIFQQSRSGNSKFVMHDLVRDLAQLVSGETIFNLEQVNKLSGRFERVRHASYIRGWWDGKNKFEVLNEVEEHLRTFLSVDIKGSSLSSYITNTVLFDILPKLKKLRVLSLTGYRITQLPNSIKDLRLLSYLNLTGTDIRSLPESASSLLNLQILILRNCSRLIILPLKLRNLVNLYHLDIQGAILLKEMPLGMKQLKYLHNLSNFIVGEGGTISGLKDLKDLKFLTGELCISGLENVNDPRDASEAALWEKVNLEALALVWHWQLSNSRDEATERNVLDALQPHKNIKRLAIRYYGGVSFPSWIGDVSFSKLEVLEIKNCENCLSLPSLGLLCSLKSLTIKGMKGLKCIGSDIYGKGISNPFPSLEILHFENLKELEYWDTDIKENQHDKIFPLLFELSIIDCPKLSGKLPELLPSLERLVASKCPELVVSVSGFPMLSKLDIDECKGLMCSTPINSEMIKCMTISKSSLNIYGCQRMLYNSTIGDLLNFVTISNNFEFGKYLKQGFQMVDTLEIGSCEIDQWWRQHGVFEGVKPVQGLDILTSHDEVSIEENHISLVSFPDINLPLHNIRSLKISGYSKPLKSLPEELMGNNGQLEILYIENCDSLSFITKRKLPSSLKSLEICACQNLQRLVEHEDDTSSSSFSLLTLKIISIMNCPELTTLSSGTRLLQALEYLDIFRCPKLESIADDLQNLNYLRSISIHDCPSLVSFAEKGFPNTISSVSIGDCEKLKTLPDDMHKLNSLQDLVLSNIISFPSNILSFPKEGFPTNLISLTIGDVKLYKALMEWGLHRLSSLKNLDIEGCHDAESFPDEEIGMILPASLKWLSIRELPKLKYLSNSMGFGSGTSLKFLEISDCPNLTSFPAVGLPSSLLQLFMNRCPLLKKECKRDKGKEWSKISHIPCVKIDFKFIYDPEEEE